MSDDEKIKKAIHREHLLELQKYTFGELIEAIDKNHRPIRAIRHDQLVSWGNNKEIKDGKHLSGGPAIIIVWRGFGLSRVDYDSMDKYNNRDIGGWKEEWERN